MPTAKLFFLCGKMAAEKSTLARGLAHREHAMLLVPDEWLGRLYPVEIIDVPAFITYSSRLNDALTPHICAMIGRGVSIVARLSRQHTPAACVVPAAARDIWRRARAPRHRRARCGVQAAAPRSQRRPSGGHQVDDRRGIRRVTAYFDPPSPDEGFTLIRHQRV